MKKFDRQLLDTLEKNLSERVACELEIPPGAVRAAVAVIIRNGERGAQVCFIKRARCRFDRFSGHIAFPGGAAEPADADLPAVAVRETFEEIGVDIGKCGKILGRLDDEIPRAPAGDERHYVVTPFVCALLKDAQVAASDEAEKIFWIPATDLKKSYFAQRHGTAGAAQFFYAGERIWGMTARIISKFLQIFP